MEEKIVKRKVRELIKKGEGVSIEFKECREELTREVYYTICAFLNRNGGELLLGVNDSGKIQGINKEKIEQIKKDFVNAINNPEKISPSVYLSIEEVEINKEKILYIYVPRSSQVHRCANKVFDRNEDGDMDITSNHNLVSTLYLNKQTAYSENKVYPFCKITDLRKDLIDKARQMALNQNSNHPWKNLSNIGLLKSAKLYTKDYQTNEEGITLAGILLFGKDETILSVLPHYKTDLILRKINLDRYDDRDDVRTNLIESFDRIIAFGQKHLSDPFYTEGNQRISARDKILREIASNILIHREFLSPFPAKMIIEQEKLITENANKPNGHGAINPKDFSPYPKNPVIAKFFKEIGNADELGSGVRNITKYASVYSKSIPEFIEQGIFKMIIKLNQISTPQATPQATPQDERIKKIMEFCKNPKTREEIQNYIDIKDREYFRKEILNPLIKQKLLFMTDPNKPKSPNQKYYSK